MRVEQLGELSPHESIPEWLVSNRIDVPYFPGTQLRFVFRDVEDDSVPDEFALAVRRFLALTIRDRDNAAQYVFRNYREICEVVLGMRRTRRRPLRLR